MEDSLDSRLAEYLDIHDERYSYWLRKGVIYRKTLIAIEETIKEYEQDLLAFLARNKDASDEESENNRCLPFRRINNLLYDWFNKVYPVNYFLFVRTVADLAHDLTFAATPEELKIDFIEMVIGYVQRRANVLLDLYKDRYSLRLLAEKFPQQDDDLLIHPFMKKLWDAGVLKRDPIRGFYSPMKSLRTSLLKLDPEEAVLIDVDFVRTNIKQDTGENFKDDSIQNDLGKARNRH